MRKVRNPLLRCSEEEKCRLLVISRSKTAHYREVQRAEILLKSMDGEWITAIVECFGTNRPPYYRIISRYNIPHLLK